MGLYLEREDSTNGRKISTGDNIRVIETDERGFVVTALGDEFIVSINGDVRNYFEDEIEWID